MPQRPDIGTLRREVREVQDQYPSWTLDNAFVHWFLQAFLVADPERAAAAVTGVAHDKGIDAVLIDDDVSKVFLVQGKFRQTPTARLEPRAEVMAFSQLAEKLVTNERAYIAFAETLAPSVAAKLAEARRRVRNRHYQVDLYYVTTGKCSAPLKSEAEAAIGQANAQTDLTILDRADILNLLIDYLSGAAPPVPYLDLRIDSRGVTGSDGMIQRFDAASGIESWILTMAANDVGDLYSRAGDKLFARNIRGFLGDTAINEGMRQTLRSEPDHFWYFNNGVTIICDAARKTAERGEAILRLTNPQVINGQQTTRTLQRESVRRAAVLVRVISVPRTRARDEGTFEKLVSNIVAATNWQNAILPSDLRSNDSRQINLQREFAKLGYRYLRKRQTKSEAKRLAGLQHGFWIKKDELAQVTAACELDPYVVRSGKEGLFKQPSYDRLFDSRPVREYLSLYWTGRLVKYHGGSFPDRAYAKWHVLHFLWQRVRATLRSRAAADLYRSRAERNRWFPSIDRATEELYMAILAFYRSKRGKGPHATDISNFFYRPHQHTAFATYWNSGGNRRRRRRFERFFRRFEDEIGACIEQQ
jgi:AIPR protein